METRSISCALVIALATGPLGAQARAPLAPQWEARLDALATPVAGGHAGIGLNVRVGTYARLGLAALGGVVREVGGGSALSSRVDVTARFLLDPHGERTRGLYGGAGVSLRRDGDAAERGHLVLVIGVEGSRRRRVIPAIEVALGGGTRVGIILRSRRTLGR